MRKSSTDFGRTRILKCESNFEMTRYSSKQIPFYRTPITRRQIDAVIKTLKSGWLTTGVVCAELEKRIAEYVGCKHAVGVNSCTAGLHLSLIAVGVKPGDEVITTPFTFIASAESILHAGAKPVFVDIDPDSFNIDPDLIEDRITKRTRAIMPVHIAGLPCEMDELAAIAKKHRLKIVHDAAHGIGSEYRGARIGAIPDISAFSFYATKNITTGEGGMITTSNDKWADDLRVLRLHGMDRHAWKRYEGAGSWYFEVKKLGFKCNLADLNASVGLAQMDEFENMQAHRARTAGWYDSELSGIEEIVLPPRNDYTVHSWHLYIIRLRTDRLSVSRDQIVEDLKAEGVGSSVHFIPVFRHPYYRRALKLSVRDFPGADKLYKCVITLPFFPGLRRWEVSEVARRLRKIIGRYARS